MKCSSCGAPLTERYAVVRRVTDATSGQGPLAVYTCPAWRTQLEVLPSPSELRDRKELVKQIKRAEKEHSRVTLLFAAKDANCSNAVVLLEVLRAKKETQ